MLEDLRSAVADLVAAAPDAGGRAADLRRALNLDAALAWQVHTLATSGDALSVARVIPKAGAMERFFASVRAARIPERLARSAEQAYIRYERLVRDHAGNRETFDAIVSSLRPGDGASLERLRRAAYKANAAIWGVTVRCRLNCVIFHQRPTGEHDCLVIRARLGVRRLRQDAVVGIYASSLTWGGATPATIADPNVAVDHCELLDEYCSQPVPRVERITRPDGRWADLLQLEGLGRASEVSIFWRNLSLAFPGGTTEPPHGSTAECLEPTETTVMDLLLPRGWTDPRTAQATMTPLPGPYTGSHPRPLPFEAAALHLGTRVDALHTSHAPRYPQVIRSELARMRWDAADFDLYRCIVRYPTLHAATHLVVHGPASGTIEATSK